MPVSAEDETEMPCPLKVRRCFADSSSMKTVETPDDTLLTLVHNEPERSRFVLKVGAAGIAAMALWTLIAHLFLPLLISLAVTVVLLTAYGSVLVLVTWRLVHEADRRQGELETQARRLMAGARRNQHRVEVEATAEPAGHMTAAEAADQYIAENAADKTDLAASFHHFFFMLRLEQEVRRCRREGETLSAVVIQVQVPGLEPMAHQLEEMSFDLAKLASDYPQTILLPSYIGPSQYAFYLPNTNRAEAKSIVAPLLKVLGNYHCDLAIASYPHDGGDAEKLIARALEQFDLAQVMQSA
jgi:hypothetical protein